MSWYINNNNTVVYDGTTGSNIDLDAQRFPCDTPGDAIELCSRLNGGAAWADYESEVMAICKAIYDGCARISNSLP